MGKSFDVIRYCIPKDNVAIIIPYANRPLHLRTLFYNLNRYLQIQHLHYAIYLIEPVPEQTFNRGKLLNIGYVEAKKDFAWNCTIFHDVDLLPQTLSVSYGCSYQNPAHLGAYVDQLDYSLYYEKMFGGITLLTKEQFEKCNGFANQFWGWGGEDDELSERSEKT